MFYGPSIDRIIQIYRGMTGHAPLYGRWAYGFVQSKDRYRSAKDLLDIAAEYRDAEVPLDFIVQDWFWWKHQGDPQYTDEYLEPVRMCPSALRTLHDEHVHAMISVWAKFDPNSQNYQEMKRLGLDRSRHRYLRRDQSGGARILLEQPRRRQIREGWEAFWLDSSEPENRERTK